MFPKYEELKKWAEEKNLHLDTGTYYDSISKCCCLLTACGLHEGDLYIDDYNEIQNNPREWAEHRFGNDFTNGIINGFDTPTRAKNVLGSTKYIIGYIIGREYRLMMKSEQLEQKGN